MPRKQKRGPVRDNKEGLKKALPSSAKRIAELQVKALRYLEDELEMLISMPGSAKEVLSIAKGLEAIRASQAGESATPSVRADFDLGSDV